MDKIEKAWSAIKPALLTIASDAGRWKKAWAMRQAYGEINSIREELMAVWAARGMNSSGTLRAWLNDILSGKRFRDVIEMQHVEALRIVAANVSLHRFRVFQADRDDKENQRDYETFLADAVLASVSIPGFFTLFRMSDHYFVNGGLLSTYPSFLFSQKTFPTIGFRLEDVPALSRLEQVQATKERPLPLEFTSEYLWAMFGTMMDAHDNHRGVPINFHPVIVETPASIPSTRFNLTKEDADALFTKGQSAADNVHWDEWSAEVAQPPFNDPKPNDALRIFLANASEVRRRLYEPDRWVENLTQELTYRARITADWSGLYVKEGTMEVEGSGQVFATRLVGAGFPGVASSLVDHLPFWQEKIKGEWKALPSFDTLSRVSERFSASTQPQVSL